MIAPAMFTSIFSEIEQAATKEPNKIALEMFGDDHDVRLTYAQTLDLARRTGEWLRSQGLRKGDRVAFLARLTPNWVVAYLGAMQQGIVIVPLDVEYSAKDIAPILSHIDCKVVFSVAEKEPAIKEAIRDLPITPAIVLLDLETDEADAISINSIFTSSSSASTADAPALDAEDVATIFFTSGTTGKPKGVVIPHRSISNSVNGLLRYLKVSASDKALAVLPSHHVFASLANILFPLVMGGTIVYLRTLNSAELMKTMEKGQITVFPAVPQVFYLLHQKIFDQVKSRPRLVRAIFSWMLSFSRWSQNRLGLNPGRKLFGQVHRTFGGHLRLLVSAASYFDPRIIEDFHALGFTVQQGYALTETFGGGTFTPYYDNVVGSAGKPLQGVELKLVNRDEAGVGEIALSGPSVMKGYLDDPLATAEVLRDGWFFTGDQATQDENGNVYIRGRTKEMIVLSSGKKVYPEEVELHYQQIPFIKEMCILGLKDGDDYAGSERLHAIIVPDFDTLKREKIVNSREIIREGIEKYSASLPKYKRILTYEFRTEPLPRTASRKIQRFLLANEMSNGQGGHTESAATPYRYIEGDDVLQASETSRTVLEVLKREARFDVDIHLDMNLELDLGFDSLQRIELLVQLEQLLNVRLGDDVANQTFTVRELLRTIAQRQSEGSRSNGNLKASVPATWKEIIAAANSDDLVMRYVTQPSAMSRAVHYAVLQLMRLIATIAFRLRVYGIENLPKEGPFLICPNHEGYLDGALVAAVLPYHVITKTFTLGFTPFFSGGIKDVIARTARIVPTDADTNLGRTMRVSAIGLKEKQNLIIFPEGSLSCDGELQVFKKGAAILARELHIPIVPTAIEGSFEAWSKVGDKVRFLPVSVTFGKPIIPETHEVPREQQDQEYLRLTQKIKDSISELLKENHRG
jgi:long-chain acyl-CoA synthetase